MGSSLASRVIAAYESGRRERREREEDEQLRTDRDLARKKLKFEMDRLKLQDETERQLATRRLAVQNFNLLSGTDPTPDNLRDILARMFPTQPSPIPSNLEGTETVTPEGTEISRGRVDLPFTPIRIPGVESLGVQGVTVQPLTEIGKLLQEQALARMKELSKAATLGPGQSRFVGGEEIASVPAAPAKPNISVKPLKSGGLAIIRIPEEGDPTSTEIPAPAGRNFQEISAYQREILRIREAHLKLALDKARGGGQLTPSQAIAALRLIQSEAEIEQLGFNPELQRRPLDEVEEIVARRRGFDLGELNRIASGSGVGQQEGGPTAINPETGERLRLEGGRWVPVQ